MHLLILRERTKYVEMSVVFVLHGRSVDVNREKQSGKKQDTTNYTEGAKVDSYSYIPPLADGSLSLYASHDLTATVHYCSLLSPRTGISISAVLLLTYTPSGRKTTCYLRNADFSDQDLWEFLPDQESGNS